MLVQFSVENFLSFDKAAGATDTDPKAGDQELNDLPLLDRLQSFFMITSWSMWLSRERSATRDLSRYSMK